MEESSRYTPTLGFAAFSEEALIQKGLLHLAPRVDKAPLSMLLRRPIFLYSHIVSDGNWPFLDTKLAVACALRKTGGEWLGSTRSAQLPDAFVALQVPDDIPRYYDYFGIQR
jgi:hypothetical protein